MMSLNIALCVPEIENWYVVALCAFVVDDPRMVEWSEQVDYEGKRKRSDRGRENGSANQYESLEDD